MKKINNIFLALFIVLALTSCEGLLDQSPTNQIASGNMWTTETLADKGMAGLYRPFYSNDLSKVQLNNTNNGAYGGINRFGIEAMGFCTAYDNAGYYKQYLLANSSNKASDKQLIQEWKFGYTLIHSANDAIANLHKAGMAKEKYERYLCEAKFLRAFAYHRLNLIFQGVPIYLEPISNEECTKGASTAAEVWNVVLEDLDYCIQNEYFPNNSLTVYYGRPSKGAAYALKGMVCMWLALNDNNYYNEAIKAFEEVKTSGYGLWTGKYIDMFKPENEKNCEMIFPLQFDEESGYCDNIQLAAGAWDTYTGWGHVRPSADFIDYYQNSDGSEFKWEDVDGFSMWNSLTVKQREVFFIRDGINDDSWLAEKEVIIKRIGKDVFESIYLNEGNEDRVRKAYLNRDPRLKQTILTAYEPQNCFVSGANNDENVIGKQLRWPFRRSDSDGGDIRFSDNTVARYMYKKYVSFEKNELLAAGGRSRCYNDWPLIRFTDVYLQLAEAYYQTGNFSKSQSIVNEIRSRAGMPSVTIGAGDIEKIRYERRVELCMEGINYFDELRWGTWKEMKFQGNDREYGPPCWWGFDGSEGIWYYKDNMWPWSAPLSEIQKNPNIQKREGWAY